MHPISPELEKMDLRKFKSLDDKQIFKTINEMVIKKKSGYISYRWYRPDTMIPDEKITFVHKIKDWDLVLATGFYLTELNELLVGEKEQLKESLFNNLEKYFCFSCLIYHNINCCKICCKKN